MLIYMEAELQQKLMALFNYSLKPGGIMLLGTSETPGPYTEGFKERDPKLKIFERVTLLKTNALIDFPSSFHYPKPRKVIAKTISRTDDNIEELAKQILLQYFAPSIEHEPENPPPGEDFLP